MAGLEILQTRDVCVDKLTATEGRALEISANLSSSSQIDQIRMGYVATALNSAFGRDEYEMLLRLTNSWHGRCRDDLTAIGKTPEIQGWRTDQ